MSRKKIYKIEDELSEIDFDSSDDEVEEEKKTSWQCDYCEFHHYDFSVVEEHETTCQHASKNKSAVKIQAIWRGFIVSKKKKDRELVIEEEISGGETKRNTNEDKPSRHLKGYTEEEDRIITEFMIPLEEQLK